MNHGRVRLGQLLVDARIVSLQQLEKVLEQQKTDARRLGTLLVESGLVSEVQLTQVLSQQLSVPWVSLYHIDFSRQLLGLVPRAIAERYCLVPIYVRQVRNVGDTLYVAMDDPTNEQALQECTQSSALPTRAMIASPSHIRHAIRLYYGGASVRPGASQPPKSKSSGAPVLRSNGAPAPAPEAAVELSPAAVSPAAVSPAAVSPAQVESSAAIMAPAIPRAPRPPQHLDVADASRDSTSVAQAAAPSDSAPKLEVSEIELPPRRKKGVLSLTLLDGTTIAVPRKRRRAPEPPPVPPAEPRLTMSELVSALRAAAHGADAAEVLGKDARWEKMFAALLNVLVRKGVLEDEEFLEELRNI